VSGDICSNDCSCGDCALDECDTNCSTAGCSQSTTQQFDYTDGKWQVNITVPTFASGKKDLFLNATYDGNTEEDTQTEAIDYGAAADTCDCPTSGNWLIQCSDNCDIQACDMQTNNVLLNGTGNILSLRNVTNATRIRIQGGCIVRW